MALFFECTRECCRKELDSANIVREAIFQPLLFFQAWRNAPTIRYVET